MSWTNHPYGLPPTSECDCDHSWSGLSASIGNRIIYGDGSVDLLPNVAWCHVCGEQWDLDDLEVAAASAILDGFALCARLAHERERAC